MSSFHEEIDKIRRSRTTFYSLRELNVKLKKLNSSISLIKLSKILRGIQNPSNQKEFQDLMNIFEITHSEEVAKLEKLANNFVPVHTPNEEELNQGLPTFINKKFKDENELEEWTKNFKEIIKKDYEPEP